MSVIEVPHPPQAPLPRPAAPPGRTVPPGPAGPPPGRLYDARTELRRAPTWVTVIIRFFGVSALLLSWGILYVVGLSSFSAARSQQLLYADFRATVSETNGDTYVPIGGAIPLGTPIALIEAPQIGLRYVVVEGTDGDDLRAGPGHKRNTPLPGQAGVSVIYGRSLAYGGPFRHITELVPGDAITVTTGQGTFTYLVEKIRRAGDPIPDTLPSDGSRLRLVTAEGVSWRDGWAADRTVYVDSILQGPTLPTPAGRPTAVSASEEALASEPGALVPVVLWLQLLLIVGCGLAWAQVRWGSSPTWLVGLPVLLAALWAASDSAMALLPNLM